MSPDPNIIKKSRANRDRQQPYGDPSCLTDHEAAAENTETLEGPDCSHDDKKHGDDRQDDFRSVRLLSGCCWYSFILAPSRRDENTYETGAGFVDWRLIDLVAKAGRLNFYDCTDDYR
jgi:hypothetical protein